MSTKIISTLLTLSFNSLNFITQSEFGTFHSHTCVRFKLPSPNACLIVAKFTVALFPKFAHCCRIHRVGPHTDKKTNSVDLSPLTNYTDWATATCRRNLVPTFVARGVSRGQRGGSPTVVNLSFLDHINDFKYKYLKIRTFTQRCEILNTDSQDMLILSSTVALRY
jgi:hypothetical protein